MYWRPISTAPKDGTVIIACGQKDKTLLVEIYDATWVGNTWWRNNNGYSFSVNCHPTHWIPVPIMEEESCQ